MDVIIGIAGTIFVGFVATMLFGMLVMFAKGTVEVKDTATDDTQVIIRTELVMHNNQTVYLLFNHVTNKFIGQTLTPEASVEMLLEKFTGKKIMLINLADDSLVPMGKP